MGEGWFATLEECPKSALSQTIPSMMRCNVLSVVVPDERKAAAVKATLTEPVSTAVPASIMRTHPNCHLWLDPPSASLLAGVDANSVLLGSAEASLLRDAVAQASSAQGLVSTSLVAVVAAFAASVALARN